jgi:hypothetical protein
LEERSKAVPSKRTKKTLIALRADLNGQSLFQIGQRFLVFSSRRALHGGVQKVPLAEPKAHILGAFFILPIPIDIKFRLLRHNLDRLD